MPGAGPFAVKGAGLDFIFLRREGLAPRKNLPISSEPGGPRLRELLDHKLVAAWPCAAPHA
jgi:hypothetical protein